MSKTQDTFQRVELYYAPEHLTLVRPAHMARDLKAHIERRECWCKACNSRVTVTREKIECGHKRDCVHHRSKDE